MGVTYLRLSMEFSSIIILLLLFGVSFSFIFGGVRCGIIERGLFFGARGALDMSWCFLGVI